VSKVFQFNEQLDIGKHGEAEVYELLDQDGWKVEVVNDLFLQSRGLDAFITKDSKSYSIEVKTDLRAVSTGNAFLELEITRSDRPPEPGWVYKTCAQLVLYYLPGKALYALDTRSIRSVVGLKQRGSERKIDNRDYSARGRVVSLPILYGEAGIWKMGLN
jgi:hypothetical protein